MMNDEVELRETLAVAAMADDLSPDAMPTQVIGAMGAASITRDVARPAWAATLTSHLDRAKFAGDTDARRRAIVFFALQLRRCIGILGRAKGGAPHIFGIAYIVVHEWVNDRCLPCGGLGRHERARDGLASSRRLCSRCAGSGRADHHPPPHWGRWPTDLNPVALILRPTVYRSCGDCGGYGTLTGQEVVHRGGGVCIACSGSGKRAVDPAWRAKVLGLSMKEYERHWAVAIDKARGLLLDGEEAGIRRLRFTLRRHIVAAHEPAEVPVVFTSDKK